MDVTRDGPVQVSPMQGLKTMTDIPTYSLSLREIDSMRVDGKFVTQGGQKVRQFLVAGRAGILIATTYLG